jgi:hypothetical protein
MKILILLLITISTSICHAKETSFIREYTYKASDLDSRVSARNNTLKLIKAGVLEEIVTYVYNDSKMEQSQTGNDFRSSFIQRTSTSSAGFLKARILEENWDGFQMRIKAEVNADPEKVRGELERALAQKPQAPIQAVPTVNAPAATVVSPAHNQLPPVMPVRSTTADYSGYMRAAQLANVYSMLQPLKIRMTEYYMMNGEWPVSLSDIRLDPEEMTDGQYLEKVRLGNNGQILAYLSDTFGKGKRMSLSPQSIMGGMQTRWNCTTNVNTDALTGLSSLNCREDEKL